ncbi:MAG: ATP-binding cassette domain-containing protein [Clostridiales bacterium]|jgi:hypothetical protein|nr:ATP-binding cassette domain-containing protein [Clostridiales bacterium]
MALRLEHVKWDLPDDSGLNKEIIKDINLKFDDGKLIVVTGPNGGGKTTLAKLIAGVVMPKSGKIFLSEGETERDITELDVTERARSGIAYAFQQPVRFKGLTVRNLLEIAAGRTMSQNELCKLLGKVGLCAEEYINREMNTSLSGGESKRIEIATVLARNAKISVFDEPEAGIDLWSFTKLVETFEEIRKSRKGILIIISHQERIISIADDIVVIADGTIRAFGTKEEILPTLLSDEKAARCPINLKEAEY